MKDLKFKIKVGIKNKEIASKEKTVLPFITLNWKIIILTSMKLKTIFQKENLIKIN